MATVAELLIALGVDSGPLDKGFKQAEGKVQGFAGRVSSGVTGAFTGLGNVISGALVGATTVAVAGAAAAVVGIGAAAVSTEADFREASRNIQAGLGETQARAEELAGVAEQIWGNQFADSTAEAAGLVQDATLQFRNFNQEISDSDLQSLVEGATALADTFDTQITGPSGVFATGATLAADFETSVDDTLGLITESLRQGVPEDILETLTEYSQNFQDAGFSAEEMFSILVSGSRAGVVQTDQLADAVRELGIRANEGGEGFASAFDSVTGMSFENVQAAIASGEASFSDYFQNILDGLDNIADPLERNRVLVELFGTKAEDLGPNFLNGVSTAVDALQDVEGAVDSLNVRYDSFTALLEGGRRQLFIAFRPLGDAILNLANELLPLAIIGFEAFADLAGPAVEGVAKIIEGITDPISSVISSLSGGFGAESLELPGFVSDLPAAVQEISQTVQGAFGNIVDFLQSRVVPFFVDTLFPTLASIGTTFVNDVLPVLLNVGSVILAQVLPALTTIGGVVLDIAGFALPLLAQGFQWFAENSGIILPILIGIGAAIAVLASPILLVTGLIIGLAAAWNNNLLGIQDITASVVGALTQFWADHGQSIMTIFGGIAALVGAVIGDLVSIVQVAVDAISALWAAHGETVLANLGLMWENIKILFEAGLAIIGEVIDLVAALIEGDWAAAWESLKNIVDIAWTALVEGMKNNFEILKNVFQEGVNTVTGIFSDFDWAGLGSSVGEGIVGGAKDALSSLGDAISGAVGGALDAAQSALGIKSPSELAAKKIGRPSGEGVTLGYEEGLGDLGAITEEAFSSVDLDAQASSVFSPTNIEKMTFQQTNNLPQGTDEGMIDKIFKRTDELIDVKLLEFARA